METGLQLPLNVSITPQPHVMPNSAGLDNLYNTSNSIERILQGGKEIKTVNSVISGVILKGILLCLAAVSAVQPFSDVVGMGMCGEFTETPLSVLETLISRSKRRTNLIHKQIDY